MSLTLEDFLRITKENDDAQQRQRFLEQQERDHLRDQDQKIRASERAADLAAIEKLVESGVKNEVSRVIQPIQEKNEERLGNIESEMSELKTLLKSVQQYTPSTILNASDSTPLTNPSDVHHVAPPPDITTSSDVQAALAKAKRIISLQPIEKVRDVDRQFRMHESVTSDEEAMLSAVLEYFRYEMKCKEEDLPKIVRVFPPVNTPA